MKYIVFYLLLAVSVLWGPGAAQAVQREEDPSEAMVRKIAKDLRCAVCQNQSVYESNSELAKDMLVVIRDKVRAGEEEARIRDYFFQRYGDYIYLEPTGEGKNKILWWVPVLGLSMGGVGLWFALTRWKRSLAPTETGSPEVTEAVKTRIQQALDRVEV
ncbi:MAG: cytochrome c-type biogenesis protein CcmH [Magnetococcales bacterium]|nr:cytochrome c-type biogenesis protein CcmH [Magnetococcales bacterium]